LPVVPKKLLLGSSSLPRCSR